MRRVRPTGHTAGKCSAGGDCAESARYSSREGVEALAQRLDQAAVLVLLVLGCIHNFVAAPASFGALDARALWFVTGGIVLWYAAAINHLATRQEIEDSGRRIVFSCNLVLVGFATMFMWVRSSWMNPQNIALMAPAVWLLIRSTLNLRGHSAPGPESR